jgi:quercetin dioxygenase-like cupin family protein
MIRWLAAAVLLLVASSAPAGEWLLRTPDGLAWRPSESLPPGALVAVLEGDPSQEGFFTMRVKMPDGYRVPPHSHSKHERVTVLSGTLHLGHGDAFDPKAAKPLGPGTYSSMPAGMRHFGWASGEVVLQLSTMGPWTVTYVHPEDDPRKR